MPHDHAGSGVFSARVTRGLWHYGLLAFCISLFVLFLLYPIFLTVKGAFVVDPKDPNSPLTLQNLSLVFQDPSLRAGLFNSFKIAACTTTLATLIALPLAMLSASYRFPGKSFFNAIVLVPLILPPFVGAMGVRAMMGRQGAVNALLGTEMDLFAGSLDLFGLSIPTRFIGIVMLQSLSLYPIIFLNATAALANLDPALDEAAENLGAGFWKRFFKITLPLIRPGLFAGATIVFIWSFTELGTPLMFDMKQVTPVQIFEGLKEVESSPRPYALVVVMLTCAVSLYLVGRVLFGRKGYSMQTRASRASSEKVLTGGKGLIAAGAFALVAIMAIGPHVGVVLTSITVPGQWYGTVLPTHTTLDHYEQALTAGDSFGAIVTSLKFALIAMVVDIGLGIVVAYLIVRTNVKGRGVLDALCMLPLAVPGLVLAFGYAAMSLQWPFAKGGPLDMFGIFTANPNPALFLVIAYSIRRLPYMVRSTVAGLEQTSGELEEAAVNLGASRITAMRRVIVPLIAANLIAGGLLVFSFSMLEVSDSLILAQQPNDFPITKSILMFTERLGDGIYIASALGVWGMALLTVTLFGASALLGKKLGSIFRV